VSAVEQIVKGTEPWPDYFLEANPDCGGATYAGEPRAMGCGR